MICVGAPVDVKDVNPKLGMAVVNNHATQLTEQVQNENDHRRDGSCWLNNETIPYSTRSYPHYIGMS